jgi:hypothetical protein
MTAVLWKRVELPHGSKHLLTLRRAHVFHRLVALDHAAALFRRHIVKLGEAVAQVLLDSRRKSTETGLVLKRALLLGKRQIAVAVHPLLQMFLPLRPHSPLLGVTSPIAHARWRRTKAASMSSALRRGQCA